MKTRMMLVVSLAIAMVLLTGCGSTKAKTGFLSDYSKLEKESDTSLRYVNQKAIAGYTGFIIDPVKVVYSPDSKAKGKLTDQQLTELTTYTNTKIREAVQKAGKKIVYQPAAGVARIRVALTDMEKASAVSAIPQASLMGVGIGGASMEAEVVDSMTGVQVGAVVESAKGTRIPFANLGDLSSARNVIDGWAKRLQERLEEAK